MAQNKIYLPIDTYWKLKKLSSNSSIKGILNSLLEKYIEDKFIIKNTGRRSNLKSNDSKATTLEWKDDNFKKQVYNKMEKDNNKNLSALITELIKRDLKEGDHIG